MPEKAHRSDQHSIPNHDTHQSEDDRDHDGLSGARFASERQRAPHKQQQDDELDLARVDEIGHRTSIGLFQQGHRIRVGSKGYLMEQGGATATFTVGHVSKETGLASAWVDAPKSEVQGRKVIVDPASPPKMWPPRGADIGARLTGMEVIDFNAARTKVLLMAGLQHGVRTGMRGHVVLEHGRAAHFTIIKTTPGECRAITEGVQMEQLRKRPVVINSAKDREP